MPEPTPTGGETREGLTIDQWVERYRLVRADAIRCANESGERLREIHAWVKHMSELDSQIARLTRERDDLAVYNYGVMERICAAAGSPLLYPDGVVDLVARLTAQVQAMTPVVEAAAAFHGAWTSTAWDNSAPMREAAAVLSGAVAAYRTALTSPPHAPEARHE